MDDFKSDIENQAKDGGWLSAYYDLLAHGLHWKKAAFCAWYNAPKQTREPKTQDALAEMLNYKSPQVFYKWQKQAWFRELGIDRLREAILLKHLGDVDRRTIEEAIAAEGSVGVAARRLFYEQLKMATPENADINIDITFKRALDKAYSDSDENEDKSE